MISVQGSLPNAPMRRKEFQICIDQMTIMIMIVNHHNHDYHCHYQHRRSKLSKYGLMTSQINELWLGIGKPIIYHSADHKMMLMKIVNIKADRHDPAK